MEISKHETLWLQSEGTKMLMELGVKTGDHVIDFGCGKGRYTIPLSKAVGQKGCIYAVECDKKEMAVLEERLPYFSSGDIIKLLNIKDLQTTDIILNNSIDSILVFDMLQYMPPQDWDSLFSYFFHVLKPSGIICIYPAAVPHPGDIDIDLLVSKMEKAGFKYVRSHKFRMMHNIHMVDDVVYSFRVE